MRGYYYYYVQSHFKKWYNKTFIHQCGLQPFHDDHLLCICFYRPLKDKNNQWSFHRRNIQQYSMINKSIKKTNNHLILYAVNDCLAVTKLLMVLELNWTKAQLRQYNQNKEESK